MTLLREALQIFYDSPVERRYWFRWVLSAETCLRIAQDGAMDIGDPEEFKANIRNHPEGNVLAGKPIRIDDTADGIQYEYTQPEPEWSLSWRMEYV